MARFILQPRWIPWHILCLVVTLIFLRMAGWQWDVAHRQPDLDWQNAAYAVQWFVFIGFVWTQLNHIVIVFHQRNSSADIQQLLPAVHSGRV